MTQTPAGWFPDPQAPGQLRYWDGAGWTAHTQPGAATAPVNAEGAVASLVLGIVSLVACGFLTGIPAMVMGRSAVKKVDESGGRLGGRALGQAGFWTGLVGTAWTGLLLVFVIGVFVFGNSLESTFEDSCSSVYGADSSSC